MGVDRHFSHTLSTKFYKTKQKGKKRKKQGAVLQKRRTRKEKRYKKFIKRTQLLHISGSNVNGV